MKGWLLVVGLLDCGSILFGEELLIWVPVFLFAPQSSRTFHEIRRTSHQFNFIFNFNSLFLSIFNDSPAPMIDFPCPYPNCDRTFKRQANLTQHFNCQHREISPDSEPDPALNFPTEYHPKLNGTFWMLNSFSSAYLYCSSSLRQRRQFYLCTQLPSNPSRS